MLRVPYEEPRTPFQKGNLEAVAERIVKTEAQAPSMVRETEGRHEVSIVRVDFSQTIPMSLKQKIGNFKIILNAFASE